MPIGKNAIKRVVNNGYSNVKTEAPDMENSTIAQEPKKTAPKKTVAKNPVPKAVTSNKKGGTSFTNPFPKAAILRDLTQANPSEKKTKKNEPREEVKAEAIAVAEEVIETSETVSTASVTEEKTNEETIVSQEENKIEAEVEAPTAESADDAVEVKKSMESEPELAPLTTLEKVTEKNENIGCRYTNLGSPLPDYLL